MAGLAKNHADQVPEECWDPHLFSLAELYARAEVGGYYDAITAPASEQYHLLSEQEVLDWVSEKSPSRGRRYTRDFVEYTAAGMCDIMRKLRAKLKVKSEILKLGKPPRVIHDFDPGETVLAHAWAVPLERFIKTRLSWKGLKSHEKWIPFAVATAHFGGDCYIVCLDDIARDANTIPSDFCALTYLLLLLGIDIKREGHMARLWRMGVSLVTKMGGLVSKLIRLFSGASFTSGMNWCTSRFMWYCILRWVGLSHNEAIVVAEGDDNFCVIEGAAARRLRLDELLTEDFIASLGLRLGKRLKVEAKGWFTDGTAWPAVGGMTVCLDGQWAFMPALDRAIIKAGWALNNDWASYKTVAGRVTARSWALNDRFSGVPIFWAYARAVEAYAVHLGAKPIFDAEEEYHRSEFGWSGGLASPPSILARRMYELAFGVDCGNQLILEDLLFASVADGDFTRDLTLEFRDLACRR